MGKALEEIGSDGVSFVEHRSRDEVLAFEVVDQGMGGVATPRRALQGLPHQRERVAEGFRLRHAGPAGGVLNDGVADFSQCVAARVPDAAGGKTRAGLQVQVEAGRVGVLTGGVAEMRLAQRGSIPACAGEPVGASVTICVEPQEFCPKCQNSCGFCLCRDLCGAVQV